MKHTPAPWMITRQKGELDNAYWIGTEPYHTICKVENGADDEEYGGIETELANANLIAAAPELLGALKVARNYMEMELLSNSGETVRRNLECINAAIAKAEGA